MRNAIALRTGKFAGYYSRFAERVNTSPEGDAEAPSAAQPQSNRFFRRKDAEAQRKRKEEVKRVSRAGGESPKEERFALSLGDDHGSLPTRIFEIVSTDRITARKFAQDTKLFDVVSTEANA